MIWIWLIVAAVVAVVLYFYFRPRSKVKTASVPDRVSVASTGGTGRVDYGDNPYPDEKDQPLINIQPPVGGKAGRDALRDIDKSFSFDQFTGLSAYFQ